MILQRELCFLPLTLTLSTYARAPDGTLIASERASKFFAVILRLPNSVLWKVVLGVNGEPIRNSRVDCRVSRAKVQQ